MRPPIVFAAQVKVDVPTKGSAKHHLGLCKPCAFVFKARGQFGQRVQGFLGDASGMVRVVLGVLTHWQGIRGGREGLGPKIPERTAENRAQSQSLA